MSLMSFLREKIVFLLCNFLLFFIFSIILWKIRIHGGMIFVVFIVWFFPLLLSYSLDYIKKRKYYQSLVHYHHSLDKKYLLPELMEQPTFLEGRIVQDVLEGANKQMHEHVNCYKREQKAYQEYIETWVHEIKTPIATAKLILHNRNLDEGILEELDKTELFIEQVLYFARSSYVSEDYLIREFPLKDVVTKVAKRNAKSFIYKKIKLNLGNINEIVFSDTKWVEFILNQIVTNAIKYSKQEESEIKIYTTHNENNIVLSIKDNGIGIQERDLPRVFEKGFTGESGRLYSKSTGMGLYLCKRLAEKLHLGLRIESEVDIGTTVHLVFPKSKVLLMES